MVSEDEPTAVKYPSQSPPLNDGKHPHVMIVGAGLAGLFLGLLLDKAGISYQIYERAQKVKPLGNVCTPPYTVSMQGASYTNAFF